MMKTVSRTGVKEFGIIPLDPLPLRNISATVLDGITINVSEGAMKGMKNCVINEFNIDWEKERGYMNVTCDVLSLKGQIVVSGENPEIQSTIGSNTLNGQGIAEIKLDNTNLYIEVSIYLTKKDGEIYLTMSNKNRIYLYDIGKAHFITEKVMFPNDDLSQIVSSYLNDNWRTTMKQFGSVFMNKALELFIALIAKFCDAIPTSKYITEDLNPFLKH
ncbi:unnamed protein product, partial [Brenthis ino]